MYLGKLRNLPQSPQSTPKQRPHFIYATQSTISCQPLIIHSGANETFRHETYLYSTSVYVAASHKKDASDSRQSTQRQR